MEWRENRYSRSCKLRNNKAAEIVENKESLTLDIKPNLNYNWLDWRDNEEKSNINELDNGIENEKLLKDGNKDIN